MLSRSLSSSFRDYSIHRVVQVLSLDARDTLIKTRENPAVVYTRFARCKGLQVEPDLVSSNFMKNYNRMSIAAPCFGFQTVGEKAWWTEVVMSTLLDVSIPWFSILNNFSVFSKNA